MTTSVHNDRKFSRKYAHCAFVLDANGEITIDCHIDNTQTALDNLYAQILVVVDQKRTSGTLLTPEHTQQD